MTPEALHQARRIIAGLVKARRIELGLSQRKLAEITGLGEQTIIRAEQARFWMNMKQFLIICDALKINIVYLPL